MPNDLNLNITASAKGTEAAFGTVNRQLSTLDEQAQRAGKSLDAVGKIHATPTVEVTVRDQAIGKLRADIERVKSEIAQGVTVGADTKSAERELARLQATLRKLEQEGAKKVTVTADVKQATSAVAGLNQALFAMGPAGAAASQLFGKGGLFAGAALAATGFVKMAADMETTRIGFKNLVRDGGDAMALFNQIKQFADATPFEFPELAKAGKTLLTFGVASDQVMQTLKNIGEAAAATGAPVDHLATIFGQMISRGTLSMQDLLQFSNFGVDTFGAMAAATGKTREELQKLQEQGKLTVPYIQAIATGFGIIYGGSIQTQAESFNGKLSTLIDHVKAAATAIGNDLLPVAKLLIGAFDTIARVIPSTFGSIAVQLGIAVGAGKLFGAAMDAAILKVGELKAASLAAEAAGTFTFGKGLRAAVGLLGGPWGAAMVGGILLLDHFASKSADAAAQTKVFNDALANQKGVLDNHTRSLILNELRTTNLGEAAKKLGISEEDYVNAILKQPEALSRVDSALSNTALRLGHLKELREAASAGDTKAFDDFTRQIQEQTGLTASQLQSVFDIVDGRFRGQQQLLQSGEDAWLAQASAVDKVAKSVHDLDPALSDANKEFKDLQGGIEDAKSAMDKLVDSLGIFIDHGADVAETTANQKQAVQDLSDAITKYGQNTNKAKTQIDLSTDAGRKEQQAVIDSARAIAANTEARLKNMQVSGESADQIIKDYTDQRNALITQLTLIGLNDQAARAFVDTILKAPKELDVKVVTDGMTELQNQVNALTDEIHILKFNIEFEKNLRSQGLDPNNIISPSLAPPPTMPEGFTVNGPTARGLGVSAQASTVGTIPLDISLSRALPPTQVIINVQDQKLADLIDVRIRDAAGESARTITRRRVVRI